MGTEAMVGLKRGLCCAWGKGMAIQTIAEGRRARTQKCLGAYDGVMELKDSLFLRCPRSLEPSMMLLSCWPTP